MSVEDITQIYARLEPEVRRAIPFREYFDSNTSQQRRRHIDKDLKAKVNKMTLPCFDGTGNDTAQAWVQKLETYLSYSPMTEGNAIKFAILHLTGAAHNWWHHGLITLGHKNITTYNEFTQKLINRFDQRDSEWYFKEMTHLRQTGTVQEFVNQFQNLSVMVPDLSQKKVSSHVHYRVERAHQNNGKTFRATNLGRSYPKARKVEPNTQRERPKDHPHKAPHRHEESRNDDKGRKCYFCNEQWNSGHHCQGRDEIVKKGICFRCREPWERCIQ